MYRRLVPLLIGCSAALAGAAEPAPVTGLLLPTRSNDAAQLRERVDRLASQLAARLGRIRQSSPESTVDLGPNVSRARGLERAANLDGAAKLFDGAIAEGRASIDRLGDANLLITAEVERASIALARGENARANRLLENLLRDDPSFQLRAEEDNPKLRAALKRIRPQGAVAWRAEDLGGACNGVELLAARTAEGGGLELARFTACRLVATTHARGNEPDSQLVAALVDKPELSSGPSDSSPQPVAPDNEARARAHFEVGQGLYHLGNYRDALREFAAGYSLSPKPEFRINIAQSYRGLGELGAARDQLMHFLSEAPPDHPERAQVQQLINGLDEAIAKQPHVAPTADTTKPAPATTTKEQPQQKHPRTWLWVGIGVGVAVLAAAAITVGVLVTRNPTPTIGPVSFP